MTFEGIMRGTFRASARALAFLTGFALVAIAIDSQLPPHDVPALTSKLQYFAKHKDEFDTVFLGSSRIYHQILPSIFDEQTRATGIPTRSFNFGIAGMRPPEDAYVFDQIARLRPGKLRWVFIEAAGIRFQIDRDKRGTIRALYWRDLERTVLLLRFAFTHRSKWSRKQISETAAIASEHLDLFSRRFTNMGRAHVLTDMLTQRNPPRPHLRPLGENLDGFRPVGQVEQIRADELVKLERDLEERKAEPAEVNYDAKISQIALDRLLRRIRDVGAIPVLIVPPTTSSKRFHPAPWITPQPLVLDFSDINRYPELYEPRHRLDYTHLNLAGSQIFSALLANELAATQSTQP